MIDNLYAHGYFDIEFLCGCKFNINITYRETESNIDINTNIESSKIELCNKHKSIKLSDINFNQIISDIESKTHMNILEVMKKYFTFKLPYSFDRYLEERCAE